MSLRLGRQCCHRSFRNTTTGERKRIFRNDVVSRFGRGEEEPPPPASDRGVWSRENARARRDPHQNTHPCFGALLPDHHNFWRLFPKPFVTKRVVPKCNNAQSSPEKVVAMRTKPRDHRRRFARLDRFSFQNRNKNTASFFPIHRERGMCRGLLDSFCVANL